MATTAGIPRRAIAALRVLSMDAGAPQSAETAVAARKVLRSGWVMLARIIPNPYRLGDCLHECHQLVQGGAPARVKTHVRMALAGSGIGVQHKRRILGAGPVRFDRDNRGKEQR